MKSFLSALQFLTIIPAKKNKFEDKALSEAVIYFPAVGIILGLILWALNELLLFLSFNPFFINVLLVILLIILTGALHLDGLADTFDALLSRKSKEEMLTIMRDSHIGTIGVLSLISAILLKVSLLSLLIQPLKATALVLMCALSRWSLVLAMYLFPYARKDGKAKVFFENINFKLLFLPTIILLGPLIILYQAKGLILIALIALTTFLFARIVKRKIGGLTGDVLGAINEINEVFVLFMIYIFQGRIIYG